MFTVFIKKKELKSFLITSNIFLNKNCTYFDVSIRVIIKVNTPSIPVIPKALLLRNSRPSDDITYEIIQIMLPPAYMPRNNCIGIKKLIHGPKTVHLIDSNYTCDLI